MSTADRPLTPLEQAQIRHAAAVREARGHPADRGRVQELTDATEDLLRLEREAAADRHEVDK